MKPAIKRSIGIVDQVRVALEPSYRLATFIGALLGAVVPVSTFAVLHAEVGADLAQPKALIVAGGLLYSARTVYQWGRLAFSSWAKALGFTVLLEGVMTLSDQLWLSGLALGYLCLINAIATGVTLARGAAVDPAAQQDAPQTLVPVSAQAPGSWSSTKMTKTTKPRQRTKPPSRARHVDENNGVTKHEIGSATGAVQP